MVENKAKDWVEKYKYSTLLSIIIFILFLALGYSNSNEKYKLYLDGIETNLVYGIYEENNEQYIHIDDLISVFKDNIYHDKISGKIIITTYDNLKKINKSDEEYSLKNQNDIYFNLTKVVKELQKDMVVSNKKIYVTNNEYIEASILNNRTELYDKETHNVISFVKKGDKVSLILDESVENKASKTVNVLVNIDNKSYCGYVLKDNIEYEYKKENNVESKDSVILVKADNKLMSSTDIKYVDMVAINMYRLSGVNSLVELEYTNNISEDIQVLATVNNGQSSSNYDPDITTGMLNSQSNREVVIQQLVERVEKLDGVNVEFGNLKSSDKETFTQFIKELAAVLHVNNKKIIVSVLSTQYIDLKQVVKVADYVVIQAYSARTISSKTSGPISSISYVEELLKNILEEQIDSTKVILEIPAYSILWTERRGTVINAERYDMKLMEEYVATNDIKLSLDNVSGQNYFNYTKGITTYKMWLEDKHSVIEKTKLVTKYNLAGLSIYKSGMEIKEIYSNISDILNK